MRSDALWGQVGMSASPATPSLFQSKDLELAFFESAPGHEVLRYVDAVSPHMYASPSKANAGPFEFTCAKQLEELLFARNDRIIDIAVVRIASPKMLAAVFERHAPEKPL